MAADDYASVQEEGSTTIAVKGNDSDPDGNTLSNPSILTQTQHGTTVVNADGSITYTPQSNYNGVDTLVYTVCDNGAPSLCDTATVVITVMPFNDAPVTTSISSTVPSGTLLPINLATGTSDVDGDQLTYTYSSAVGVVVTTNITGNGTLVIAPLNISDTGVVSIRFTVCDNGAPSLCDSGMIEVHYVSDSVLQTTNFAPLAVNDLSSTTPNTSVTVNVKGNDSDPNGNNTLGTPTIIHSANNGNVVVNTDGTITYIPNNNYVGNDTLSYGVCDNGAPSLCDTAMVIITVTNNAIANRAPVAADDYASVQEDGSRAIAVKTNDSDPDGNVLSTPIIITSTQHGSTVVNVDGSISYTPQSNYNGVDTLVYTVCDNGVPSMCDTATVIITVNPVNDVPVVRNETYKGTSTITGNITSNDSDVDGTVMVATTPVLTPKHGIISINSNGTFIYTPDSGYVGNDTVITNVCDNNNVCMNDTLVLEISLNHKPVVTDISGTTTENTPVTVCTIINDVDANSEFTATLCGTSNGDATFSITDKQLCVTYTPATDFTGLADVCVIVCDNGSPSLCDTVVIPITVTSKEIATDFMVPEGFSPNGDGVNDFFEIKGIENYPNNHIMIFNRWGNLVYEKQGYNNDWAGVYEGKLSIGNELPAGTYFYVLKLEEDAKPIKGYVYLSK